LSKAKNLIHSVIFIPIPTQVICVLTHDSPGFRLAVCGRNALEKLRVNSSTDN